MALNVMTIILFLLWTDLTLGLFIATIQDLKNREIADKTWAIMILFFPLLLYYAIQTFSLLEWLYWGFNVFFGFFTAILLFYSGAWGGADSKALMVLSILWPFQTLLKPAIVYGPFPIIGLLTNMIIFMIATVFWFLIINLVFKLKNKTLFENYHATLLSKFIALISCYPVSLEQARNMKFALPAESIQNNQRILKPGIFALLDEDKTEQEVLLEYLTTIQSIHNNDTQDQEKRMIQQSFEKFPYVWVRPMPPGILFLFFGWLWYSFFLSPINLILNALL